MLPAFTELTEVYFSCYRCGGVFRHFRGRPVYIYKHRIVQFRDLHVKCFPLLEIRDQSAPFVSDIIQWKTEISTVSDLTIKPSTFFPKGKYIYVFCMFVGTNNDYFLIRHSWLLMYITCVVYCTVRTELLKTAKINRSM